MPSTPSRADLIEAWERHYGQSPPKGLSTRLLHLACEYHGQVREQGGLSKKRLRELMRYADPSDGTKRRRRTVAPSPKPTSGTRLVREWRGRTHVAEIREDGVLYEGKTYRSLSQVARAITGARWSGPRFFGVCSL